MKYYRTLLFGTYSPSGVYNAHSSMSFPLYPQNAIVLLLTLTSALVTVLGYVNVSLGQLEPTVRHAFETTSRTRKAVWVSTPKSTMPVNKPMFISLYRMPTVLSRP